MKYTVEVEISAPRDKVFELFDDQQNRFKWQEGLQTLEPTEGEPGQIGSKSKIVVKTSMQTLEMVETVTSREPPEQIRFDYDSPGVHCTVQHDFAELDGETTKWESHNEFQFTGFFTFAGFFLESMLKNQSRQFMRDFKAFVEQGRDVRERGQ